MNKLIKTTITLTAIGVAVKVIEREMNKKWRTDCIIIDGYPHFLGK